MFSLNWHRESAHSTKFVQNGSWISIGDASVIFFFLYVCCAMCYAQLLQSFLTLCDPMDYSPAGSSVHGIFLARILEWVAISTSRNGECSIDIANLMPVWTFILKIFYYFSCILSTCKTASQNNREGLWPKKKKKKKNTVKNLKTTKKNKDTNKKTWMTDSCAGLCEPLSLTSSRDSYFLSLRH